MIKIKTDCGATITVNPADKAAVSFVDGFLKAEKERREKVVVWLEEIRRDPLVRAATPDDGWVDRKNNTVNFPSYAHFVETPLRPGDKVVLGWPDKWRTVIECLAPLILIPVNGGFANEK